MFPKTCATYFEIQLYISTVVLPLQISSGQPYCKSLSFISVIDVSSKTWRVGPNFSTSLQNRVVNPKGMGGSSADKLIFFSIWLCLRQVKCQMLPFKTKKTNYFQLIRMPKKIWSNRQYYQVGI